MSTDKTNEEEQELLRQEFLEWRGVESTGKDLHYCHDWDGLVVDSNSPEYDSCNCFPKEHKEKNYILVSVGSYGFMNQELT